MINPGVYKLIRRGTVLIIDGPRGEVELYVTGVNRGVGEQQYRLITEAVCWQKMEPSDRCQFKFEGGSSAGNFSKCEPLPDKENAWLATFETTIESPSFWT